MTTHLYPTHIHKTIRIVLNADSRACAHDGMENERRLAGRGGVPNSRCDMGPIKSEETGWSGVSQWQCDWKMTGDWLVAGASVTQYQFRWMTDKVTHTSVFQLTNWLLPVQRGKWPHFPFSVDKVILWLSRLSIDIVHNAARLAYLSIDIVHNASNVHWADRQRALQSCSLTLPTQSTMPVAELDYVHRCSRQCWPCLVHWPGRHSWAGAVILTSRVELENAV